MPRPAVVAVDFTVAVTAADGGEMEEVCARLQP
jgi:hypothetical protein